ncbi:MAG: transposase, partial [Cyanobacteriota bacterium]|nr:transposase [Cyanobacteriota bacterium]
MMFPLDSTIVTLTSKLLWSQGFPEMLNFLVGMGQEQVEARVVWFCAREEQTEFRLVTNLPDEGEKGISNSEIGDFYRLRWQIELFWKFLKMHLKLA